MIKYLAVAAALLAACDKKDDKAQPPVDTTKGSTVSPALKDSGVGSAAPVPPQVPGSLADAQAGSGSRPVAPAPAAGCNSDSDCELVSGEPPNCCSRCVPSAMTKADAAANNAKCQAIAKSNPDYFSRCPHLSCTCSHPTARCKSHACVVDNAPC